MTLNVNNFFHYYFFHPLSKELSSCDKCKATVASIFLWVFSLGIAPLICKIAFYNRSFKIKNGKEEPNVTNVAKNIFNGIGLEKIPLDNQLGILEFLPGSSVRTISQVSKRCREFANHDRAWTSIARREGIQLKPGTKNVKEFVREYKNSCVEFVEFFNRLFEPLRHGYDLKDADWNELLGLPPKAPWEEADGPPLWVCFSIAESDRSIIEKAHKLKAELKQIDEALAFWSPIEITDGAATGGFFNMSDPNKIDQIFIEERHMDSLKEICSIFSQLKVREVVVRTKDQSP